MLTFKLSNNRVKAIPVVKVYNFVEQKSSASRTSESGTD